MAGIKMEEAKKELEGVVAKEEVKIKDNQKALMSEEERKSFEAKEAEEIKKAEELRITTEAQAKKDAELLTKKDEEVTDESDKKRKTELLEKKRKEEENKLSAEEKLKRVEEKMQKRIDELSNQLKETKDKGSKEADTLWKELELLRKEKENLIKPKDDINALVEKEENEKQAKYLQEDKSLPREKRREMDDGELDDWLLEDQKSAIAWIQRREFRREVDKIKNISTKQKEGMTKELFEKQSQSFARVCIKHPELQIQKRQAELKSQGKSEEEITNIIRQENKKYDTVLKIAEEHPEWRTHPGSPELVMAEMEKILNAEPDKDKDMDKQKIEDLIKRVEELEAEKAEREVSDEGVSSTIIPGQRGEVKFSEMEEEMVKIMKENKMPQPYIDAAIADFRKKKGIKR